MQILNRLQRLLSELILGQCKKDLSALQAKAMLATVRPRDIAGKTRRRMAAEELADLVAVDKKLKKIKAELKATITASGSTLMEITASDPPLPPGSSPTSATSPASPTATASRPDRHRTRTPGQANRYAPAFPAPATAG